MATYNKSISISNMFDTTYGHTGGTWTNQTDFLTYTCPFNCSFSRVIPIATYINNINGDLNLTLEKVIPSWGWSRDKLFHLYANGYIATYYKLLQPDYGPMNMLDFSDVVGITDTVILTNKSICLFPGEQILATLTDSGGSIGPSELSWVTYRVIEIVA